MLPFSTIESSNLLRAMMSIELTCTICFLCLEHPKCCALVPFMISNVFGRLVMISLTSSFNCLFDLFPAYCQFLFTEISPVLPVSHPIVFTVLLWYQVAELVIQAE